MPTTRNLAILIFEEVEVLDFCGPFEVFSVANAFTDSPIFHIFTVAEKPEPVLTRGGLSVNPHHRLLDSVPPDLLLVPGGQGTRKELHNPTLIDWIKVHPQEAELTLLPREGEPWRKAATCHEGGRRWQPMTGIPRPPTSTRSMP